ncbi:MAG: hypothetical protein WC683_13555 [bacterium]
MTTAIRETSTETITLCPRCGASLGYLKECMSEPAGSPNRLIASHIIGGCRGCREMLEAAK